MLKRARSFNNRRGTMPAMIAIGALCVTVTLGLALRRSLKDRAIEVKRSSGINELSESKTSNRSNSVQTPLQTGGQFDLSLPAVAVQVQAVVLE
jgi:hypothetical protein